MLEHGWAYGTGGDALHGKEWLSAITMGGPAVAYLHDGYHGHTVRQFLAPLEQTAALCGLVVLPPFLVYGSLAMDDTTMTRHAADYQRTLQGLRDDTIELEGLRASEQINPNPANARAARRPS